MSHSDPNRGLYHALFASLLLHALLFVGLPNIIDGARRAVESLPPPIIARLIAPEPAAPPRVPAPAAAPEKPAPVPPKKVVKPTVKPAPQAQPVPAPPPPVASPEPTPVEPTPAPAVPAPPRAQPSTDAAAAEKAAAEAQARARAAEAAAREARTIGEYRLELIEAARRIKDRTRYPPLARDNNWTGNTRVSVAVPPAGAPAIAVQSSSGHQVLDQHALAIFQQATREVAVPQELRGRAFAVEVRMDFTLKD